MREVDDALREERLLGAARRYGWWIAIVVGLALAALAGWLWYSAHQTAKVGKTGEKYVVALDQLEAGRLPEASRALTPLMSDAAPGPRAATRLVRAGIALEQGSRAEAARIYAAVAADADAPRAYRDVATIREVATRFDSLPPEQVIARLKGLAVPGNPWFGSAGELVGAAYLKQGKPELAGPLFAAVAKDPKVPETLRSRARQMAGLLGVDALGEIDPVDATGGVPSGQR